MRLILSFLCNFSIKVLQNVLFKLKMLCNARDLAQFSTSNLFVLKVVVFAPAFSCIAKFFYFADRRQTASFVIQHNFL